MTREERQAKAAKAAKQKKSNGFKCRIIYNPLKLICESHSVAFVRFMYVEKYSKYYSHGCPVCVGLIRAEVHKLVRNGFALRVKMKRNCNAPTKRGRSKTSTATAAIETRNEI